jgi:DNA-binding XRE family transcriptional regulator
MKNLIRTFRLENRLTQQTLANRVEMTRMMISLFERWRRDPQLGPGFRLERELTRYSPTNNRPSHRRSQSQRNQNSNPLQSKPPG